MAIYTYQCLVCGGKGEVVQSISSYCVKPEVPECCETPMERYLTPVMTTFDTAPWSAYKSPIDGEVIDSRAKRNEHMAKHGVVPFEEVKPDFARAQARIKKEQAVERRNDIVEAVQMAQAGQITKAEVADKAVHEYLAAT